MQTISLHLQLNCFKVRIAIVFIILAVVCDRAYGQPVFTFNCNPVTGDTIRLFRVDTTGLAEGGMGASQTWNFSVALPDTPYAEIVYVNPAGTPYQTHFSSANVVAKLSGTGLYMYFIADSTSLMLLGNASPEIVAASTNPSTTRIYPMELNQTVTDSVVTSWSSESMRSAGSKTLTYDAYGSLTINGKTFANAVRLHSVEEVTNTYGTRNVLVQSESFEWIDSVNGDVLMQITNSTVDAGEDNEGQMQVVTVTSNAID